MTLLVLAAFFFIGLHVLPGATKTRESMVSVVGEGAYKSLFASFSLVSLALMVLGWMNAEPIQVWHPTNWSAFLVFSIMPLSFILIITAYYPTNVRRYVRFPFLWGVLLWSLCHVAISGDVASIVFFGAFALLSLLEMQVLDRPEPAPEVASVNDFWLVFILVLVYSIALWLHGFTFLTEMTV